MNRLEPLINGTPFSTYGAAALAGYTVGATEITNYTYLGVNRTSWNQLKTMFGMRSISIDVKFIAADLETATINKSLFDAALWGQTELWLPDGFYYTVYVESLGDALIEADTAKGAIISATYSFKGIRHKALETVTIAAGGGTLICRSTTPFTDCIYEVTVTASASSYSLGGATFNNVSAGERLTFDGINKRILRNGVDNALNVTWTQFPTLTPGSNTVTGTYATTIKYYPTFI